MAENCRVTSCVEGEGQGSKASPACACIKVQGLPRVKPQSHSSPLGMDVMYFFTARPGLPKTPANTLASDGRLPSESPWQWWPYSPAC